MALLKIEQLGAPVLRKPAGEISEIDEEVRTLVEDMFATMYHAEGIGLAGPQIGVSRRLVVIDIREEGVERLALINPRIVESSKETETEEEGCLSIPGVSAPVERQTRVVVEALNAEGHPVRIEGEGLLGRCLQHEIDHLEGILFVDHLSPLKRRMLLKRWKNLRAAESAA